YRALDASDYLWNVYRMDSLKQHGLFSKADYELFYSYLLKTNALTAGACSKTTDNPNWELYELQYRAWFQAKTEMTASELSFFHLDLPSAPTRIRKILSLEDFEAELKEITDYIEPVLDYVYEMKISDGGVRLD